jgi:hypothetical protein
MYEGIGRLRESSLHQSIKYWYQKPGDHLEKQVDGYIIDLMRGNLCIEIQTRNFAALKKKITMLLNRYPVRLVYPVPIERMIVRIDMATERVLQIRKSPKKGTYLDLFGELIRIPHLVRDKNFEVEVLLIREEQVLVEGGGSWRNKGWSVSDRRLVEVVQGRLFASPADYLDLLPKGLPEIFTVRNLATVSRTRIRLAGKIAYCLREMDALEVCGKRARAYLYRIK